ncbi:MAG: hypothetical protein ACOH5I_07435 [Oligoflexus sp.]
MKHGEDLSGQDGELRIPKRGQKALVEGERAAHLRITVPQKFRAQVFDESEFWNVSISELLRKAVEHFMQLPDDEKHKIIFPMPKRDDMLEE